MVTVPPLSYATRGCGLLPHLPVRSVMRNYGREKSLQDSSQDWFHKRREQGMNPHIVKTKISRARRMSVTILASAVFGFSGCSGSESSQEAENTESVGTGATVSAGAPASAPLGTGFIMMTGMSELHLTEPSYLEESDCSARVSALGEAEEYAGCMEIPAAALCIQIAEGTRASDRLWECFVEEAGCEEAMAAHEVVREEGGYVREILMGCTETEMASVFASM